MKNITQIYHHLRNEGVGATAFKIKNRVLQRWIDNGLSYSAYVFIASPRSASNYICNLLVSGTSLPKVNLKTEQGIGHFSVNLNKRVSGKSPFIWYQHLFPTSRNVELVKRFSIASPIISYREPVAWVLSMAERCVGPGSPWGIKSDFVLVDRYVKQQEIDDRLKIEKSEASESLSGAIDFVIDFELPVYLRFLNGWIYATGTELRDLNPIFLDYDCFLDDPESNLDLIGMRWKRFKKERAMLSINKSENFNVGRERVHRSFFSSDQLSKINNLVQKSTAHHLFAHSALER